YNQAIVVGELVFVAGQLGLEPGDKAIEGDVATQTGQALSNLAAILEAAGSSMDKLVKTSVFLLDLADFQAMNEAYATRVRSQPPARPTFQVAALPSRARAAPGGGPPRGRARRDRGRPPPVGARQRRAAYLCRPRSAVTSARSVS